MKCRCTLSRAYRLHRRRGHVTQISPHRDNQIQTSNRALLFLVTLAALVLYIAYTEFVTIFSLGLDFDR